MFSAKDLVLNGPLYSIFNKECKIVYLGRLIKREDHPKGFVLGFERQEIVILKGLKNKLFFIEPPDWCDECYEDFGDNCWGCCSILPKEDLIFKSTNNIQSYEIVYSEK
jgi:hypothetical protein